MIDWIMSNKEWIFSGVGTAFVFFIIGWATRGKFERRMNQKSGHSSTNIQVGGDIKTGDDG